jgi:mRNA-degrading endonuclease RelE of RelBE toxin-antitoxin system
MSTNEEAQPSKEVFFTHEFKRNVRQLAKKYRRIQQDIQSILNELQGGQLPGDQVPGLAPAIYKVRARNSDGSKGKSGGYRLIYQKTEQDTIVLLTIYSKTEQADISLQEIRDIIILYEQGRSKDSE